MAPTNHNNDKMTRTQDPRQRSPSAAISTYSYGKFTMMKLFAMHFLKMQEILEEPNTYGARSVFGLNSRSAKKTSLETFKSKGVLDLPLLLLNKFNVLLIKLGKSSRIHSGVVNHSKTFQSWRSLKIQKRMRRARQWHCYCDTHSNVFSLVTALPQLIYSSRSSKNRNKWFITLNQQIIDGLVCLW